VSARSVRRGTTAVAILLAVALFVGLNYLASRHWARGDWTKTQIYSLSEQTRKILAGLKSPVRVTVFMTADSRLYQPVRELLTRYQDASPKIEVEYLDPRRSLAHA
jgi:gliding motility-associatede transport system auxiliary component